MVISARYYVVLYVHCLDCTLCNFHVTSLKLPFDKSLSSACDMPHFYSYVTRGMWHDSHICNSWHHHSPQVDEVSALMLTLGKRSRHILQHSKLIQHRIWRHSHKKWLNRAPKLREWKRYTTKIKPKTLCRLMMCLHWCLALFVGSLILSKKRFQ